MLAHFAADVVLHVIGPWFAGAQAGDPAAAARLWAVSETLTMNQPASHGGA